MSEACSLFELRDDNREASHELEADLANFLCRHAIPHLYLRKGPERGHCTMLPARTKIEFLVSRNPVVPVTELQSSAVARWVNARDLQLPAGVSSRRGGKREAEIAAIQTAMYALAQRGPAG